MLLLTSVNDRLQIVTSSTATINVHASWVDTSAGTITPGRTNTAISAPGTTSVAGTPPISTQRNVKTLHVRNTHISTGCDITIQHTDGTTVAQLYKVTLNAGDMLEYTDQAGFGGGRAPPPLGTSTTPVIRKFLASGTYTPTAGMQYVIVECIGAGGGGSGGYALSTENMQGGGGGGGSYSRSILTAAQVGASQPVIVGPGGPGATVAGSPAGPGGNTAFGSLCIAPGGGVGNAAQSVSGNVPHGGLGGAPGTGDIAIAGNPGGFGYYGTGNPVIFALSGNGGAGPMGGGATTAGLGATGSTGVGFGSGGSGGDSHYSGTGVAGGGGAAGICIITEFFR